MALDGVDLAVQPGEVVGLLGPNGAGKTTLFNCLAGVERPDQGTVWVDGVDVTRLEVYARARLGMARTFQRVELFAELTVREQLAIAARARARGGRILAKPGHGGSEEAELVESILLRLGLEEEADLDAGALSLGRTRLVELGRALATRPSVILADEPSSGLDEDERSTLARALPQAAEGGAAVALIEHDLELVCRVANRVYVLEAGSVVASGPTEEVLGDPVVVRVYGPGRGAPGLGGARRSGRGRVGPGD